VTKRKERTDETESTKPTHMGIRFTKLSSAAASKILKLLNQKKSNQITFITKKSIGMWWQMKKLTYNQR